jgi:SAM-dependent methyltransferase
MRWHVDRPTPTDRCDPLNFLVAGWLFAGERQQDVSAIEVYAQGVKLGQTFCLGLRPDVTAALALPETVRTGFEIACHARLASTTSTLTFQLRVRFTSGEVVTLDERTVPLVTVDYRIHPFGEVLDASFLPVLHREHVYVSGPSLPVGSEETATLLAKFLGAPRLRILDVGCGLGFYGKRLLAAGHAWFGVEVKTEDCAELARQGLPHQKVDGTSLPFADDSFDAAICIEVLEHIDDPAVFLREIQRVAPRRLLISVPNFEPVPYLRQHAVVPWHLLEGDHKNFFTRWSLQHLLEQYYPKVEVAGYHQMPISSPEDVPLYFNLFASASR